ncbi:uncharacterized protein METZ01_LOCUS401343, partial [marine metagenome]
MVWNPTALPGAGIEGWVKDRRVPWFRAKECWMDPLGPTDPERIDQYTLQG